MPIQQHFAVGFDTASQSQEQATRSPLVPNNATHCRSVIFSQKAPSQSCYVHGSTHPGSDALLEGERNALPMNINSILLQELQKGMGQVLQSVQIRSIRELGVR